jgi:hypothetical protein
MADPDVTIAALKACLDQIPAKESFYSVLKDMQPLLVAGIALIGGSVAWLDYRDSRKAAQIADIERKKALYWRAHTEASICSGFTAKSLKEDIDKWITEHPDEDRVDADHWINWQTRLRSLAASEYDAAYEQLSLFPIGAFNSLRMLNSYNQAIRIIASDKNISKSTAQGLSGYLLNEMIKYSSELEKALDRYVSNFTWKEKNL